METFENFYNKLTKRLSEDDLVDQLTSKFKLLFTDEERIRFILKTDIVNSAVEKWSHCGPSAQKSPTLSENLRLEGNNLFKKRNFSAALEKYTESVLNASYNQENSSCLAMALANRSAVSFQTNAYTEAINDAERAKSLGYPEKLMYKLLERIGKSYMKKNNYLKGGKYFKDALLALSRSGLSVDDKNKLAFEYFKLEKMCSNCNDEADEKEKCLDNHYDQEIEKMDCNATYPCATSAFNIVSNDRYGRHAVATREINAGELILFEKAYASILFKENRLTHCHHCFKRCKTLIGCFSCNFVGFCSDKCRDLAVVKYHSLECKFINTLYAADTGFGHLALRMVITAGFDYLCRFNDTKTVNGLNEDGVYESQSYQSVHSLIGHSDRRSLSDLFRKSVMAAFLLQFIINHDFFTSQPDESVIFNKKVCIGSHILRQLQMLPCNAHEVSELQIDAASIADSELKEIGSAIYATLSLLNHSCDPSVVRFSFGNACALRAIKKIKKGGMIIDNYGALYAVHGLVQRQELVSSQYFFDCACQACQTGWPLYNEIPAKLPEFKCSNCEQPIKNTVPSTKLHCRSCNFDLAVSPNEFQTSQNRFTAAMKAVLEGGDAKEHLPRLLDHLQLICDVVVLPWQEFNNCQEIVKQCFGMVSNHYYL